MRGVPVDGRAVGDGVEQLGAHDRLGRVSERAANAVTERHTYIRTSENGAERKRNVRDPDCGQKAVSTWLRVFLFFLSLSPWKFEREETLFDTPQNSRRCTAGGQ